MRIFVFEFITGGGWFAIDPVNPPTGSLLAEGRAMLEAVALDLVAISDVEVTTLVDVRLSGKLQRFTHSRIIEDSRQLQRELLLAAGDADFTLIIAPEFDGHLLNIVEQAIEAGATLLSPSPEFIRITSNKQATAELLGAKAVPIPAGVLISPGQSLPGDFSFPAVLKPIDGAGSMDVRLITQANEPMEPAATPVRLETYHAGIAVSVAVLCGPNGWQLLPPCRQLLSDDGHFQYQGGTCPLAPSLATRAQRLAKQAIDALPPTVGYVGIDMVLGEDASGADDVVIEVNPRLTTSYVGLRELINENLAEAMLRIAQGQSVELSTKPGRVEFSASGEVHYFDE